jgi:energy-coupling factor transporter ATP-binding protein EcfA2
MTMNSSLHHISTFFDSYEEREDAFRRAVAFKLARRYAGPSVFWQDFSGISREDTGPQETAYVAYIPSNPRDCLAFGTPRQVLMASLMSAGKSNARNTAAKVMDTACGFEIQDLLSQPIRTLSGGETVKLALAKTSVGMDDCSRVVVASPFTWLSQANRHLLETIVTQAHEKQKSISILALTGEGNLAPIDDKDPFLKPFPATIPFRLDLSQVRIPLSVSLHPLAGEAAHAAIENRSLALSSPCLIVGDNGQGKSLLARTMAKAISFKGDVTIESPASERPPCLLFQDVLAQTILRTFPALMGVMGGQQEERTRKCYGDIQQHYAAAAAHVPDVALPLIGDFENRMHSLLDTKTILVATRLAARPAALILDEPDWGMSRASAIAFVSAVLSAAHRRKTPVFLISHKPWWQTVTRSSVRVTRTMDKDGNTSSVPVFTIHLAKEEESL